MQYFVKAVYAGLVTGLGSLLAALQVSDDLGISDLGTATWVTIGLATLLAVGGVLGLQNAPSSVSTSTRSN